MYIYLNVDFKDKNKDSWDIEWSSKRITEITKYKRMLKYILNIDLLLLKIIFV